MSKVHALLRLLAGTGLGSRRRRYRIPVTIRPMKSDWEKAVVLPAPLGGFAGTIVDFNAEVQKVEDGSVPMRNYDLNDIVQAEQDLRGLSKELLKMQGRKSFPPWSLPGELFWVILSPIVQSLGPTPLPLALTAANSTISRQIRHNKD